MSAQQLGVWIVDEEKLSMGCRCNVGEPSETSDLREKAFGPRAFWCLGNSKGSGVSGLSAGRKSLDCLRFTVYRFMVTVLFSFTRGTQYF